jgi:hypothetical protein
MTAKSVCRCACCERARTASALGEHLLRADEDLYRHTGNGMHAWIAYRRARIARAIPPAWVLEYFDACYAALKQPRGTSSPKAIATALHLHTRGGGRPARERAITEQRYAAIIQHLRHYRREAQRKGRITVQVRDEILYRVAEESKLSYDRVRNIWFEYAVPSKRKPKS